MLFKAIEYHVEPDYFGNVKLIVLYQATLCGNTVFDYCLFTFSEAEAEKAIAELESRGVIRKEKSEKGEEK
mgnify:CR=1 FL=1